MPISFGFNAAYPDDPIFTSIEEGDGLKIRNNGKSTTLAAASKAQINGKSLSVVKLADKASGKGKGWRGGQFTFKSADFQSFMEQVGRLHDMEIVYEGEVPKKN